MQQSCASFELGMAGARDARGVELQPQHNPALSVKLQCHGDGYSVVQLPEGKPVAGFPKSGILVDTDPNTGRLLGRNGTICFLIEGSQLRKLTHTRSTALARFLPDGNVMVADGRIVRVINPQGETVRKPELPAEPLLGQIAPDGKQAVLLTANPGAGLTAGIVRIDLQTWAITRLPATDRPVQLAHLNWVPGSDQVQVLPYREQPWLLNAKTGATEPAPGNPVIYAPDGRWLVDFSGGKVSLGQRGSAHRVALWGELGPDQRPMAFWSADAMHVLLPGGQVIEVDTGKAVASPQRLKTCVAPAPVMLGGRGDSLVAVYVANCH